MTRDKRQDVAGAKGEPVVAFVIEELSIGGAEHMLVALANCFLARGWQVHMICLSKAGELVNILDKGVTLHVLDKHIGIDLRLPSRLIRCIRKINPDVVNSHLWVANSWSRLSLLFKKLPIIATEHSRDTWKPTHFRVVDRLLARRMFCMVTVSHDTANFYTEEVGIPKDKVQVINNGVDTKHFASGNGTQLKQDWFAGHAEDERAKFLIGTVGRLVSAKNHQRLIDATAALINDPEIAKQYDIHLKIVGEGPERAHIQGHINDLGLQQHVSLAGARNDTADVFAAFDLFALSSDREGHPLTALEAQSAGTPVVLTDAGGAAEAIAREGDQAGGVLVQPSVEAMTEALRDLLLNTEKHALYSSFAQRFALEHFDKRKMIDRYEAIFNDAMANR